MNQLPAARSNTQVVANPFTSERKASNAVAATEESRAIAEIQGAVFMAKQFPRDSVQAVDRILNACTRPSLAEAALYSYSRGGSEITGPSIRLAEAMAQAWGNMAFGIQELDQRFGESTVQAYAWDLETNTRRVVTFQVPHIRYTKNGSKPLTDPRDIYEMVANQGARRLRACILSVIPGDVTESAVKQCELTMETSMPNTPEAIKNMLGWFAGLGVSSEQIAKKMQCRVDALRPAQMVQLHKIFTSIKDGMSSPEDWFEPASITEPPKEKPTPAKQSKPKPAPAPAPAKPTQAQPTTWLIYGSDGKVGFSLDTPQDWAATFMDWVETQGDAEELAVILDKNRPIADKAMHHLDEATQAAISAAVKAKQAALSDADTPPPHDPKTGEVYDDGDGLDFSE